MVILHNAKSLRIIMKYVLYIILYNWKTNNQNNFIFDNNRKIIIVIAIDFDHSSKSKIANRS